MSYTGKFKVKMSVQQRLLHKTYIDSSWAYAQFSLLKVMAVRYGENTRMICLEDKAVVPLGEPDVPIWDNNNNNNNNIVI